MRDVLRALSLMARGAEELEAWEEEEVREALRDCLEGRLEGFESLSEVKRRVPGEGLRTPSSLRWVKSWILLAHTR